MALSDGAEGRRLVSTPVEDGAEAFVEMLNSNGVEYLFLNSGTDTFPVLEALERMMAQERTVPRIILCIDETTAMFAAHGYYQLTGRAQAVLVHVDAGTINIGGAYHDAQRDHAAIVVCAGRAPSTFGGAVAGARDMNIHWTQEQRDQAGIVRTFTKWDYELRNLDSINWVVQKAFQVAAAEPAGPVYLTLPRELLLERMTELGVPPSQRHGRPAGPAADREALRTLAGWLAEAERPLIVAGASGRYTETVSVLAELAELAGAPVVGAIGSRLNMPTHNALNAATCGAALRGRGRPHRRRRLRRSVDTGPGDARAQRPRRMDRHRPYEGHDPAVGVPGRPVGPCVVAHRAARAAGRAARTAHAGGPRARRRPLRGVRSQQPARARAARCASAKRQGRAPHPSVVGRVLPRSGARARRHRDERGA